MSTRLGKEGEQRARHYLEQHGLRWVCSNYHAPPGEIDLVMQEEGVLVFVEVRYRRETDYGQSIETVAWHKQSRLTKAACCYLVETHQMDKVDGRFDVIGLSDDRKIYWIRNAFEVKY